MVDEKQITEELLAFGKSIASEELFPTVVYEAAPLIANDSYTFAIACCLDRGTKAEIIWTIPYYMKKDLGHLDPKLIYRMSLDELTALFQRLPQRPRYVNDAPKTIRDLTRIVVEECDGDTSNLWKGKPAAEVNRTFTSIHGVGSGIANMTVLLIEAAFRIRFSDLDHTHMDIKPDVHTMKVLYRLGVSEAEITDATIEATRRMNPNFPGELDAPLWSLGRKWCFASEPNCLECPLNASCGHHFN